MGLQARIGLQPTVRRAAAYGARGCLRVVRVGDILDEDLQRDPPPAEHVLVAAELLLLEKRRQRVDDQPPVVGRGLLQPHQPRLL